MLTKLGTYSQGVVWTPPGTEDNKLETHCIKGGKELRGRRTSAVRARVSEGAVSVHVDLLDTGAAGLQEKVASIRLVNENSLGAGVRA